MWLHWLKRQHYVYVDLSSDQLGTTTFLVQWSMGLNADSGSAAMTHSLLWAPDAVHLVNEKE